MKNYFLILVLCLLGANYHSYGQATCDDTNISVTSGVNGGTETKHAQNTLETQSGTSVVIEGNGDVTYKAGTKITLNSGFKVEVGSTFKALIEDCNAIQDSTKFITEWYIALDSTQITIPTEGSGYDYSVDWGDGTVTINHTGNASYVYPESGTYQIKISGDFPRIKFKGFVGNKENQRIKKIIQWGDIQWKSMEGAFYGCLNMIIDPLISDTPELSEVTDMSQMFAKATIIDYNFGSWDVTNIQDMTQMLTGTNVSCTNYEATLNAWAQQSGLQPNVTLGADLIEYSDSTGRDILTDTGTGGLNWTINGDTLVTTCSRSMSSNVGKEGVKELEIYPNPAGKRIYISGLSEKQNNTSIRIIDMSGRTVLQVKNQDQVDISSLKSGMYFVEILAEKRILSKLIKL